MYFRARRPCCRRSGKRAITYTSTRSQRLRDGAPCARPRLPRRAPVGGGYQRDTIEQCHTSAIRLKRRLPAYSIQMARSLLRSCARQAHENCVPKCVGWGARPPPLWSAMLGTLSVRRTSAHSTSSRMYALSRPCLSAAAVGFGLHSRGRSGPVLGFVIATGRFAASCLIDENASYAIERDRYSARRLVACLT
jgi:hypothetical protein